MITVVIIKLKNRLHQHACNIKTNYKLSVNFLYTIGFNKQLTDNCNFTKFDKKGID